MAKNRYVNTRFWSDNFVVELEPLEKYLFLYFLTNEHTNICGIYELPKRTIAFETGIASKHIDQLFRKLEGKVYHIDGWVYVKNFAKHQKSNESVKIGIEKAKKEVPNKIMTIVSQIDTDCYNVPQTAPDCDLSKPELEPVSKPEPVSELEEPTQTETPITGGAKPKSYGREDINQICDFLKEQIGQTLDGTRAENRNFAKLLIDKLKKDFPKHNTVELIEVLIVKGLLDGFHGKNITGFKYLYKHCAKIINSIKQTDDGGYV